VRVTTTTTKEIRRSRSEERFWEVYFWGVEREKASTRGCVKERWRWRRREESFDIEKEKERQARSDGHDDDDDEHGHVYETREKKARARKEEKRKNLTRPPKKRKIDILGPNDF